MFLFYLIIKTLNFISVTLNRELNIDRHVLQKSKSEMCNNLQKRLSFFAKFKETYFDYCSTIFTFIKQSLLMKLEECFKKSLKQILGLRVSQLNIEEQFQLFKPFRIYPLHFCLFKNYCLLLYNLIKNG